MAPQRASEALEFAGGLYSDGDPDLGFLEHQDRPSWKSEKRCVLGATGPRKAPGIGIAGLSDRHR